MGKSKYYYNRETCQYERAKISIWNIIWYTLGTLVVGGIMFVGLVVISDQLIETEKEASLRSENEALKKHRVILTNQLQGVESSLSYLRAQDNKIHDQLFDVDENQRSGSTNRNHSNAILLSSPEEYTIRFNELKSRTEKLFQRSAKVNTAIGTRMSITPDDAFLLESLPTLPPIKDMNTELMVSGFGVRINPFHKGRYSHQGLDLAAPRGTLVYATAPGRVSKINRSSLQAGYGNYVEVDHGNGFITRYAHMDDIIVKQGQQVSKDEHIGFVGSTGGSIVPHVHYEIIQHGENVDPMIYMIEGLSSQQYNELVLLSKKLNQSLD